MMLPNCFHDNVEQIMQLIRIAGGAIWRWDKWRLDDSINRHNRGLFPLWRIDCHGRISLKKLEIMNCNFQSLKTAALNMDFLHLYLPSRYARYLVENQNF